MTNDEPTARPSTFFFVTVFVAALPIPSWFLSRAGGFDATRPLDVLGAFVLGNLVALASERMLADGGGRAAPAHVRWVAFGAISATAFAGLLAVMPFVAEALGSAGITDPSRWDGTPALLRYWCAVAAFLLMAGLIASAEPETPAERAKRRAARKGRIPGANQARSRESPTRRPAAWSW